MAVLFFVFFRLCYFILFNLYNTHQVLVGIPQGVGGLAILFYFYNTDHVLPQGVVGLAMLFIYFISIYFCNTHQVLIGLPQGLGGLPIWFIYFICFYFALFV